MKPLLIFSMAMMLAIAGARAEEPSSWLKDLVERLREQGAESTVRNLAKRLQGELPKGWTVSYDAQYACLNVARKERALADRERINASGEEKPQLEEIRFSFRVFPNITPDEYARLAKENARIQEEVNAIYKLLDQRRDISRKFDSFLPEKEADKKLVARYESLKESKHELPDFHYEGIGLQWFENGPEAQSPWVVRPMDPGVFKEFDAARKSVVKVLTPYTGEHEQR